MMLKGKGIGHGVVEGEVLLSRQPISFLGGVDPHTGVVIDSSSDISGKNVTGKILAFPHGKGSTVGSYVIYQLMKSGKAPGGMINESAETVVATGAIIAGIPMLSNIPLAALETGDQVLLNADAGLLELKGVVSEAIAMSVLMNRDRILLLKHEGKSKHLEGEWLGVSDKISGGDNPEKVALRAVRSQTGIDADESEIRVRGETIYLRARSVLLEVHPFLIATDKTEIDLGKGYKEFKWVSPDRLKSVRTIAGMSTIVDSLLSRKEASRKTC